MTNPNLSSHQFMDIHEAVGLRSHDWGVPMHSAEGEMQRYWKDWSTGDPSAVDEPHPSEVAHGGPGPYLEHLERDITRRGIQQPIEVRRSPSGERGVYDGQHRLVAAMRAGLTRVPYVETN